MYTVNGAHPTYGMKDRELQDGDAVIWHYVNDYAYEVHDWDNLGGEGWPSMGGDTFHNAWLEAADINPPSDEAGERFWNDHARNDCYKRAGFSERRPKRNWTRRWKRRLPMRKRL